MKSRVEKAVKILKGYCDKQVDCDKCKFKIENEMCMLQERVPCD